MSKDYHHLTQDQRCQIAVLKKRGESNAKIAKELGVNPSTISREVARNKGISFEKVTQEDLDKVESLLNRHTIIAPKKRVAP